MNSKVGNISIIIFFTMVNITIFLYFFMPFLDNHFANNTWQTGIYFILFSFLLYLPISRSVTKIPLLKSYTNNYLLRISLAVYFFLQTVILLSMTVRILVTLIFYDYTETLFIIGLLVALFYLCRNGIMNLFHISIIFLLFLIGGYFLIFFSDMPLRQFHLLLPLETISLNSNNIAVLLLLYVPLDIFIGYYLKDFYSEKFRKRTLFYPFVFFGVAISLFTFDFTSIFDTLFMRNFEFLGMTILNIQNNYNYFGDINFFKVIFLTVICIVKCSFNLINFRMVTNLKNRKIYIVVLIFIIGLCTFIVNQHFHVLQRSFEMIFLVFIILLLPSYLYLIIKRRPPDVT